MTGPEGRAEGRVRADHQTMEEVTKALGVKGKQQIQNQSQSPASACKRRAAPGSTTLTHLHIYVYMYTLVYSTWGMSENCSSV